jgi:hypothetical protein
MMRSLVIVGLIMLATLSRLVPHGPNFAPICAIAFFGGMRFHNRWAAFLVPLVAMLLSDLALHVGTNLQVFDGWMAKGTGVYPDMIFVYLGVALASLLGVLLQKRDRPAAIVGGILGSSLVFFLITNLGFWLLVNSYPDAPGWTRPEHTLAGLLQCFRDAIPFYKMSLLGDVVYGAALFGGFAVLERFVPALQVRAAQA